MFDFSRDVFQTTVEGWEFLLERFVNYTWFLWRGRGNCEIEIGKSRKIEKQIAAQKEYGNKEDTGIFLDFLALEIADEVNRSIHFSQM